MPPKTPKRPRQDEQQEGTPQGDDEHHFTDTHQLSEAKQPTNNPPPNVTVGDSPRRAAVFRQAQRERQRAAFVNAAPGDNVSLEWRLTDALDADDDPEWVRWVGVVVRADGTGGGQVRWRADCEQLDGAGRLAASTSSAGQHLAV
jgi:hypothetical protein